MWDSESCKKGMGKVMAAAGCGEGERARGRNVLLADLQCVVVRFGGAVVTWRGTEGSSSKSRMGSQPLRAMGSAGSRVGSAGLGVPWSLQSRATGGVGLLCFWIPVMEVPEFCSRVKGSGAVCALPPPLARVCWQRAGDSAGRAMAVLPRPAQRWHWRDRVCPSLHSVPSIPGWMGEPRRRQWSCSQPSLQPQAPSRAAFGRGSWVKPRAPYTVNQAVRVGLEPKPERKGKKWVSFLELSLAPAGKEGPMILHHFAFSLSPLTQTVPRTRCVLPGPAGARRMPQQEHLSHEDAMGRPCSHLHCPWRELLPGSCSPVSALLAERFLLQAWKARAQGLLPVPVSVPSESTAPA